jgi:transcriptional regulator
MDYLEQVKGWKKRRVKIVKLRESGMSFTEIADKLEITRQRVQQLYNAEVKK